MPHISLRFFGLGSRASGSHLETRFVPEGTTIQELWESVRSSADDHDFLARMNERQVSILLNGKLIRRAEGLQSVLGQEDVVTFMVLVTGG